MINLKITLYAMEISYSELSRRVGLTQPAIARIVNKRSTTTKTAVKIAKAVGVSLDTLCGLQESDNSFAVDKLAQVMGKLAQIRHVIDN